MPHNSKQREKVKKFINIINIINKVKKFINWERAILVSLLGVFIALFLILSPQFPKFLNRSEKAKKMLNDSQSKLLKSEDDLCNDSRLTETEVIEPELIKDEEYLFRENNCVSISEESLNEESLNKGNLNEESSNVKKIVIFLANKKILVTLSNPNNIRLWDITATNQQSENIFSQKNSPLKECIVTDSTGIQPYLSLYLYKNKKNTVLTVKSDKEPQSDSSSEPEFCLPSSKSKKDNEPKELERVNISSIAFDPSGNKLAIGIEDGTIALWNVNVEATNKKEIFKPYSVFPEQNKNDSKKDDKFINNLAFNYDGKYLASGANDGTIQLWEIIDDKKEVIEKDTIPLDKYKLKNITNNKRESEASITTLAFSPQKNILAVGISPFYDGKTDYKNQDGLIQLWQIDDSVKDSGTLKEMGSPAWIIAPKKEVEYSIVSLDFSPDGNFLASGSGSMTGVNWDVFGGNIKIWKIDMKAKKVMTQVGEDFPMDHKDWVNSVKFTPNGEILASASDDKTVKLWDVRNLDKPIKLDSLSDFSKAISSVAFSPDGKTLAIMSDDKTIKLWQLQ